MLPGWRAADLLATLHRRSPVGVLLRHRTPGARGGDQRAARPGRVTVIGLPSELVLQACGREIGRVQLDGAPADVEALTWRPGEHDAAAVRWVLMRAPDYGGAPRATSESPSWRALSPSPPYPPATRQMADFEPAAKVVDL